MRRFVIAAAAVIAAFALSPTSVRAQGLPPAHPVVATSPTPFPWWGFVCPGSIILSAVVADFKDNRQLTYLEAYTCGLLYWIPLPPQPKKKKHHAAALTVDRPRYG